MKNAEYTPDQISRKMPQEKSADEKSVELNDTDLDSVAGGIIWHLPNEPVSTPWDESDET